MQKCNILLTNQLLLTIEFVKPRVEEIVAVEETPGPDEIPIVEEPDDDTEQILEPAKTEKQL